MSDLNKKQQAAMDLIAGMEQPTAEELEGLTILAKANELPDEMQEQLDEQLSIQHDLDDTADKLKELKENVKSKWNGIRGLARNWGSDMFHQAPASESQDPRMKPRPSVKEMAKSKEFAEGKKAGEEGQGTLANPYPMGSEAFTCWALGQATGEQIRNAMNPNPPENSSENGEEDSRFVDGQGKPLKGLDRAAQQGRIAWVEGKSTSDNPYQSAGHRDAWERGWKDARTCGERGREAFVSNGHRAENPWKADGFEAPLHQAWKIGLHAAMEEGTATAPDEEDKAAPKKRKGTKAKTGSDEYEREGMDAFNAGKTLNEDPYQSGEGASVVWSDYWQKGFKLAMKAFDKGCAAGRKGAEISSCPFSEDPAQQRALGEAWVAGWKSVREVA